MQRNVGNQASHTDLNVMSCLEYAVSVLKVKAVILCGHYGCGAVKAALKLPSKTSGLVNCWISDIRECRLDKGGACIHESVTQCSPSSETKTSTSSRV